MAERQAKERESSQRHSFDGPLTRDPARFDAAVDGLLQQGQGVNGAPEPALASCPDASTLEGPRPRRGQPEQTRARLVQTAAQLFNRVPYWEADTNAVAREAGYSTGTFYRHFKDKREVFIAAYREWIAEEWANIEATISPGQTPAESIDRAADALIEHHRRWRVFRGNVRALVTYDEELRELTQALRREQLEKMSLLRKLMGHQPARTLESDAVHAMMFERVCDGIADGEFKSLGCSVEVAQREFQQLMRSYLLDPWMPEHPKAGT